MPGARAFGFGAFADLLDEDQHPTGIDITVTDDMHGAAMRQIDLEDTLADGIPREEGHRREGGNRIGGGLARIG